MTLPSVLSTKAECVIGKPGSLRPRVVVARVIATPIGAPISAPAACSSSTTSRGRSRLSDDKGPGTKSTGDHERKAVKYADGATRGKNHKGKGKGKDKGEAKGDIGLNEDRNVWNKRCSVDDGKRRPATTRPTGSTPHSADSKQVDKGWDKWNVFNNSGENKRRSSEQSPSQRHTTASLHRPQTTSSRSAPRNERGKCGESRTGERGDRGKRDRDERGERVHNEGTSSDRRPEWSGERGNDEWWGSEQQNDERRNSERRRGKNDGVDVRKGRGTISSGSRDWRGSYQTERQQDGYLASNKRDGDDSGGKQVRSRSPRRRHAGGDESRCSSQRRERGDNVVARRSLHPKSFDTLRCERGRHAGDAGAQENGKRLKSDSSADRRGGGDNGQPGWNKGTSERLTSNRANGKKENGYDEDDNHDGKHYGDKGQSRGKCSNRVLNNKDCGKLSNASAVKHEEKNDIHGNKNNNDKTRPSVPDWRARYTVQRNPSQSKKQESQPKNQESQDTQRNRPQNRRSRSRSKHDQSRGTQRNRSQRRRSPSRRKQRRSRERSTPRGGATRRLPREGTMEDTLKSSLELKREERQRKLAAVLAMGVDPATAEMAVDDPRFDISMYQQGGAAAAGQEESAEVYDVKVVRIEDDGKEAYKTILLHKKGASQVDIDGPERMTRDEALADSQNVQASYENGGEAAARETVSRLHQIVWTSNDLIQALSNDRLRKINYVMLCGVATEEEATGIVDDTPDFDLEVWVATRYKAANAVKMPEPSGNVVRQGSRWWIASFTCYEANEDGVSFTTHKVYAPKQQDGSKANLDLAAFREAFERGGYDALLAEEKRLAHHVWTKEALDHHSGPGETKEFTSEETELPDLPSQIIEDEEMPITLSGHHDFLAMPSWDEGVYNGFVSQDIADILVEKGLITPTPIQQHTASIIAAGYDLLAAAQTGSGKTIAFLAPILKKITQVPRPHIAGSAAFASPLAIFLSPTRELAQQTHKWLDMLSPFKTLCLFGGEPLHQQLAIISNQQIDCICATPGRLLDALDCSKVSLAAVQAVVVDEADHMLGQSGGLDTTVTSVLSGRDMPANRQMILFSATFPAGFEMACRSMLRADNHCVVHVGNYEDCAGGSTDRIGQNFVYAGRTERWKYLIRDLNIYWTSGKAILFANRIADAAPLIRLMRENDVKADHLHGKLRQQEREEVVQRFAEGKFDLLVCTNLGARGLDFPDIDLVVQLELPPSLEVYTHRIGRTGRQGRQGHALSYFGPRDKPLARPLCDFLATLSQEVPDWLSELCQ
eukprot:GEMP01002000.1.p1 GENE.GEMP01002000.1~~GEMP01002000.1.p1  ORF type:complete len:1286 (+),score=268.78 GEMP01002000.1:531-4388(+)